MVWGGRQSTMIGDTCCEKTIQWVNYWYCSLVRSAESHSVTIPTWELFFYHVCFILGCDFVGEYTKNTQINKSPFSVSANVFSFAHRRMCICPKRVGCFGSSTRFQMRKVVGKWYEWYRFCKKIMSLVYAKISDDIGMCFMCALRVSTCECRVCSSAVSRYLMY
jgi:hypothetical protein